MPNIDNFVQVTVTKTSASVTRQGFGIPLGLFQVDTGVQASRYASYSSTAEMTTAGFASTAPAFLWAQTVLGQEFSPVALAIGRRGLGANQVDTVTIATADAGTWDITIDSIVYAYVADGGDTELTIAQGLLDAVAADLDNAVTVPTVPLVAANFAVTAWVGGEAFVNGGITVAGGGAGTFVNTTPDGVAEVIGDALTAIRLENDEWYQLNIESRQEADILLANTWVAGELKILVVQSNDPDVLTTTVPNIGSDLGATNNKRTQLRWWHRVKDFMDGAMTGRAAAFQLDQPDGVGTWAIKQLQVVAPRVPALTTAEIANATANNADVYTETGGRGVTQTGASVEGEFMDVQTSLDWTQTRIQEDVFAAKATTPTKIPYTDPGIAIIDAAVLGVLRRGVTNGHYSADDPNLPKVTVPRAADVPVADKNARVLNGVIGEAILAGAIHKTIVQVNVTA